MTTENREMERSAAFPDVEQSGREPVFNLPAIIVIIIGLCTGLHLIRFWALSQQQDIWLIARFAFIPLRYSGPYLLDFYAFVSPWSYSFLHGSIGHLAVNMIWLAAFGSPLANRVGAVRFLAFWLVTSLAAVLLHFVLHSHELVPLVGASGAISGMMGAAARFGFRIDRRSGTPSFAGPVLPVSVVLRSRTVVTFLSVWFVINLLMGFGFGAPDDGSVIAWEAHIGGFLAGFLLIRPFVRRP